MSQITLEAFDLSVKIKQRLLFHIPSIKIFPGDAIYLSGQNGIGKTTLLKVLAGLQKPTSGHLNLKKPSLLQRLAGFYGQSGVLYMHQQPYLFDGSVFDNICYGLKQKGASRRTQQQLCLQALQFIEMTGLKHEHISALSGGERQKIAMARAWVLNPSIILMDETSANLDADAINVQKRMLDDLLAKGSAAVITSHQSNQLTSGCKLQWIIENQKLIHRTKLNIIDKNKGDHVIGY